MQMAGAGDFGMGETRLVGWRVGRVPYYEYLSTLVCSACCLCTDYSDFALLGWRVRRFFHAISGSACVLPDFALLGWWVGVCLRDGREGRVGAD